MKIKILLILILSISVTVNFAIYSVAYIAYDQYNDLRLDPLGKYEKKMFEFEPKEYEIILLGDSHAANWKISNREVLNLGIPGQTSNQIVIRSEMLRKKVKGKTLIIITGSNDIKSIMTNKDRNNEIVKQCLTNIEEIVVNHRGQFEKVFVMTVPPIFKVPKKYWLLYDESISESLLELNEGIRKYCGANSLVTVLDAYEILDKKRKDENLSSDGVHMNSKAYSYLFKLLTKEI